MSAVVHVEAITKVESEKTVVSADNEKIHACTFVKLISLIYILPL